MSWTTKPLSEILDQSGRHRAGDQNLPVLSITMKYGLIDQGDKFKKRIASSDTSSYRIAYKNELVVGFPIDEGVLGFQTKYPAGIVSPAYDIWRLKNETDCHIPYLERYLRSSQARSLYASQMQGAVARRRSLTKADFLNLEIPFPSFNEQVRIANLLDKVEGLIAQRKQHLEQLDDFLKSIFLKMFGDPVQNEMGWEKKRLSTLLVDIESGKSPKCEARPASEIEWGVLKLGAVTKCAYDERENKALPKNILPSLRDEVKAGDILFSRKNTYDLVAACAYVFATRPGLLMPDLIFRLVFRDDAEVNPIFIWKLLTAKSQRKAIQSLASGAAGSMPNISKTNLRQVQIPVPPLPIQEKFATIVDKVEGLKSSYQQSLADIQSLYGTLSQQAFKGKLDVSNVPLPVIELGEEKTVAAEPINASAEQLLAINLPDIANLLEAVESDETRNALLSQWLEAYRDQLGNTSFSVQHFMATAQTRLEELHPNNDFVLGAYDYEQIKSWVFDSLAAGTLKQTFDDARSLIELKPILA